MTINLPWVYCLVLVAVIQEACITLSPRTHATRSRQVLAVFEQELWPTLVDIKRDDYC